MALGLERVPATLQLSAVGPGIALIVVLPLGSLAARRGSWLGSLGLTIALVGQSFPVSWLGIMLFLFFPSACRSCRVRAAAVTLIVLLIIVVSGNRRFHGGSFACVATSE